MLDKVIRFVDESFRGKDIPHHKKTVFWIKHFRPDADEALLIAGYAHDIERASRDPNIAEIITKSSKGVLDDEFLKHHQNRGAQIMANFLEKNNVQGNIIDRVVLLISKHEEGGNEDQNLLRDCDSLSFFETNALNFISKKVKTMGKQKVREKFERMYKRIENGEIKKIAKPIFDKRMAELDKTN